MGRAASFAAVVWALCAAFCAAAEAASPLYPSSHTPSVSSRFDPFEGTVNTTAPPSGANATRDLCVLTLNCGQGVALLARYGQGAQWIAYVVERAGADVVFLQEISPRLATDVRDELARRDGPVWELAGEPRHGVATIARRMPLVREFQFNRAARGFRGTRAIAAEALLWPGAAGAPPVKLVNAHQYPLWGALRVKRGFSPAGEIAHSAWYLTHRAGLGATLRALVLDPGNSPGMATVWGGDFNEPSLLDYTAEAEASANVTRERGDRVRAGLRWPASRAMLALGFRDTFREAHPRPAAEPGLTCPVMRPSPAHSPPRDRIDFVYVRDGGRVRFRTLRSEVFGRGHGWALPADGVIVDLEAARAALRNAPPGGWARNANLDDLAPKGGVAAAAVRRHVQAVASSAASPSVPSVWASDHFAVRTVVRATVELGSGP